MPNAFYRNTSSSAKKKSDRERRQSAFSAPEEAPDTGAPASAAEPGSSPRKGRAARQDDRASRGEGRSMLTWTPSITPSSLVTMSFLALLLLGFTFLSGVIVGRGTLPIPQAVELEPLVSEAAKASEREEMPEKILPKEELRFMTSLKSEDAGGVLSQAGQGAVEEKPSAAKKEKKSAKAPEAKKDPQFDFVLRAASFKDKAQASSLQSRLAKAGMKAVVADAKAKSGRWYYVHVLLRGSQADLRQLRGRLASGYRLTDCMLIDEKPVKQKPAKGRKK